jgi:hypothetical protein
MVERVKSWLMVTFTVLFVVVYTLALFGWVRPTTDITVIARLEPIIFMMIGYFFGRFPGLHYEKALREEIERQVRKADAAVQAKEQSEIECEVMEEKIKNARAALLPLDEQPTLLNESEPVSDKETQRHRRAIGRYVHTAVRILDF